MASTPYRVAGPVGSDAPRIPTRTGLDLAGVAAFVWVLTLVRVVAAVAQAEPLNRELGLAAVVLLLAPVVVWKDIDARRAGR